MNNHYKEGPVEAHDFIEEVLTHLQEESDISHTAAWDIGMALKYAIRCGRKEGEPWQNDARKCADYLSKVITGSWLRE